MEDSFDLKRRPKIGETYWVLDEEGVRVCCQIWMNDAIDIQRYEENNVFKTSKEAFCWAVKKRKEEMKENIGKCEACNHCHDNADIGYAACAKAPYCIWEFNEELLKEEI